MSWMVSVTSQTEVVHFTSCNSGSISARASNSFGDSILMRPSRRNPLCNALNINGCASQPGRGASRFKEEPERFCKRVVDRDIRTATWNPTARRTILVG
jgi:hypothetical protein